MEGQAYDLLRWGLRMHLALPGDLHGLPYCATWTHGLLYCAILRLPETKTASRTVRVQSVLIKEPPLINLLACIFYKDAERTLLCPGGTLGLQRKFLLLKELVVGIETTPWTLASVRGGGCVHCALHSQDMDYLQWKGRSQRYAPLHAAWAGGCYLQSPSEPSQDTSHDFGPTGVPTPSHERSVDAIRENTGKGWKRLRNS
eukprot:4469735-Amphidinium_carterae.1